MDEIEKVDGVETENNAEVAEVETDKVETEADSKETPVERPKESDEARRGRLQRELTKLNKKLGVEKTIEDSKAKKSDELDYAQKAFLKSSGINTEEFDLVKQVMQESGKDLDSVLESGYFKAELKSRRDIKALNDAMPKTNNRSGEPASNQVEHWLKKGGLPPKTPENQKLRQDIVNARYDLAKSGQHVSF